MAVEPTPLPIEGLRLLLTTEDEQLVLWQDGAIQPIAPSPAVFSASFIGDNGTIAYVRDNELWCFDAASQQAQPVALPPELAADPSYAENPSFTLFWLTAVPHQPQFVGTLFNYNQDRQDIIWADCASHSSQRIESPHPGTPIISPDGNLLAIAGLEAISVYDLTSQQASTLLSFPAISTYSGAMFHPALAWSSDGSQLLTLIHPSDWWYEQLDDPSILYRLTVADGTVEELAALNHLFVREPHAAVLFAAEKVAYSSSTDPSQIPFGYHPAQLTILDVDSGSQTAVFTGSAGFVGRNPSDGQTGITGWNPSGSRISFWQGDRPDALQLAIYDLDQQTTLETELSGSFQGWLNDSTFLLLSQNSLSLAIIENGTISLHELASDVARVHHGRIFP